MIMRRRSSPDWYLILGVSPTASNAQITRAYRVGLRQHHPDTRRLADPTDPAQAAAADAALSQVRAAYTILGDPARRAAYDRHHAAARTPGRPTHPITIHASAPPRWDTPSPIRAGPVRWHP